MCDPEEEGKGHEMLKKDFARNSPYTLPFEAAIRAFFLVDPRANVLPNLEQTYT